VIGRAKTLEQLDDDFAVVPLSDAVNESFPRIDVDAETRQRLIYGQRVEMPGLDERAAGVFGPDGAVVALAALVEGVPRSLVVFA
jgi:tRNA pseudouridine55 synthase